MTANGGDIPSFYSVEWSPDNSTWYVLNAGDGWYLSYNYSVSYIFNTTYQYFRVRAQNGVGMSDVYSPVLSVLSDVLPIAMTTPTLVKVTPGNITISWTALTNTTANGGDLPIFYQVEWFDA